MSDTDKNHLFALEKQMACLPRRRGDAHFEFSLRSPVAALFAEPSPRSLSTAQRGYAARCGGAYEGYFSNFRRAGFIWSHVCASDVHTSTCGLNQLGSSRLAALIATMSGCESVMTWIGEPQSGQKLRWVLPPASLGESWERSEPWESLKASDGTMTKDEKGPPLDCWQSLQ